MLTDKVDFEVSKTIRVYTERLGCEVVEITVQADHVHLLVKVPPKIAISKLLGAVKGKTALHVFKQISYLKVKPYWVKSKPRSRVWFFTLHLLNYCTNRWMLKMEAIFPKTKYY